MRVYFRAFPQNFTEFSAFSWIIEFYACINHNTSLHLVCTITNCQHVPQPIFCVAISVQQFQNSHLKNRRCAKRQIKQSKNTFFSKSNKNTLCLYFMFLEQIVQIPIPFTIFLYIGKLQCLDNKSQHFSYDKRACIAFKWRAFKFIIFICQLQIYILSQFMLTSDRTVKPVWFSMLFYLCNNTQKLGCLRSSIIQIFRKTFKSATNSWYKTGEKQIQQYQ